MAPADDTPSRGSVRGRERGAIGCFRRPARGQNAAGSAALRGAALRVVGYAVTVVLGVLSAALLFRHLGVADSGRYVTVLSLVALVGGLTEGGLTAIGTREFATARATSRARTLRMLLGMRVTLTVAGVAVAVGFAAVAGYDSILVIGTVLAGVACSSRTSKLPRRSRCRPSCASDGSPPQTWCVS